MTSTKCVVRNFVILPVDNILSDRACVHGPSACRHNANSTVNENSL